MDRSQTFNTLTVRFSLPLLPHHIPRWRGAVIESAGWDQELFHNHDNHQPALVPVSPNGAHPKERTSTIAVNDVYHYRYPLIHYRVMNGQAAVWGINEGVEALRSWLLNSDRTFHISGRETELMIAGMQERKYALKMLPSHRMYRLMDYLPLDEENYQRWLDAEDLCERVRLLERILAGNIITFANAVDWRLPERLDVKLMHIRAVKTVKVHGTKLMAFNLLYKANIALPPEVALGRKISFGFGEQHPTKT